MADKKKGPGLDVTIASILSGAQQLASSYYNAEINSIISEMNQAQSEFNEKMAEINAVEAIEQGNEEALNYRRKVNTLIGKQRSNAAAQGVAVDFGTVEEAVQQTYEFGQEDVRTIKNNAWKKAFGFETEAVEHRISAKMGKVKQKINYNNTLIGGGFKAFNTGIRTYSSFSSLDKATSKDKLKGNKNA